MDLRNITKIVRNMTLYKNSVNKEKEYLNETEYEMVRYITKRNYRSQVEVANYLNVDKGLVTRMCKKLVNLGYLEVKSDPLDSRKKLLSTTSKASLLKDERTKEEIEFYNACIKNLNDEEKKQLDYLIEKVYIESKKLRKNGFKGIKNETNTL